MEAGLRTHGATLAKVGATNAALESLRPVINNQDEFWKEKRGQAVYGAGVGWGTYGAGKVIGRYNWGDLAKRSFGTFLEKLSRAYDHGRIYNKRNIERLFGDLSFMSCLAERLGKHVPQRLKDVTDKPRAALDRASKKSLPSAVVRRAIKGSLPGSVLSNWLQSRED